jgi:glucose-1-phosphate cytidylyltransferase
MKVVILAGGLGTRLSEETKTIPKPMIEIGGKPMLWHIMNWYASFGHKEFIICCGYKGESIKKYFWDLTMHRRDAVFNGETATISLLSEKTDLSNWKVTCVDTGENTMTGGRIARVSHLLDGEPFMLTYGDGVGNVDLALLERKHKEMRASVTITAVQHPARFGILDINPAGFINSFAEKSGEHSYWINGGFSIVDGLVGTSKYADNTVWEMDVLPFLAEKGKLLAYKHTGFWKCMDTLKDKMEFEEMFQKKGNIYGN